MNDRDYKIFSNRATRILLLEMSVESFLLEHGKCSCKACEAARLALYLKYKRRK